MSEPKLTVGRVQTWRPIRLNEYDNGDVRMLIQELNARMAELFPPAPPQPEAKAEPDRVRAAIDRLHSRAVAAAGPSDERWQDAEDDASAIDARIAELTRERDEARAELRDIYEAEPVLTYERHKAWKNAMDNGYRAGVAAAKEACAKRLEDVQDGKIVGSSTSFHVGVLYAARLVRQTEVPGP